MKIIEGYTPSKGLLLVICFMGLNMGIQLYLVTQVGTVEIVGNQVESNLVTVSLFVSYAITMISLLFILSEFFLMRKVESMFGVGELKAIGNTKKEDLVELDPADPDEIINIAEEQTESLEIEEDDPFADLLASAAEEEIVEEEEDEEDPKAKYKVLGFKLPEQEEPEEEEDTILVPDPGFSMDHVSIDSFVPDEEPVEVPKPEELEEPEFDFNQSEIIQTITELKEVVNELKIRTGRA